MRGIYFLIGFALFIVAMYFLNRKFHFIKVAVKTGGCPVSRNYFSKSTSEGDYL